MEPELSPCVHLERHTSSTNITPIIIQKKNVPLPAFPPSLHLKEPQTKHTSLIPAERLQEISWQDIWRSHAPRGASKNPAKDFCYWDLYGVCKNPIYQGFLLVGSQWCLSVYLVVSVQW